MRRSQRVWTLIGMTLSLALLVSTAYLVGCGKAAATGGGGAKINLSMQVAKGARRMAAGSSRLTQGQSAAATTDGLTSLKLWIVSVQICHSVTLTGSAITASSGCVTLYTNPVTEPASFSASLISSANLAAALSDAQTATGFTDLKSGSITGSASITTANSFNYGIVTVAPIVKATATLADPGTGNPVFYTHAGVANGSCTDGGVSSYTCVVAPSFTTAPADEATFHAGLGTLVFGFQNPLNIAASDITGATTVSLALAFNLDSLIQGVVNGASNSPPLLDGLAATGGAGANSINLVGASVSAAFSSSASTTIIQESYTTTLYDAGDTGNYELRVDLFSVQGDSAATIYGVSINSVPTSTSQSYLTGYTQAYGVTTNTDGSVNLLDYAGNPVISNLKRVTTKGATTTGQVVCQHSFFGSTLPPPPANPRNCWDGASAPANDGTLMPASTFTLATLGPMS